MKKKICIISALCAACVISPVYALAEPAKEGAPERAETADILLMEFQTIPVEEILEAYFGEEKSDGGLVKKRESVYGPGAVDYTYRDNTVILTYTIYEDVGSSQLHVSFPGEVPGEEELKKEWEGVLRRLDLPLTGEYVRRKESYYDIYVYGIEADGIQICPDRYTLGGMGSETDYYGSNVSAGIERDGDRDGYSLTFYWMRDIKERVPVESARKLHTQEEVKQLVYEELEGSWGYKLGEDLTVDEESIVCVPMYFMVDLGGSAGEGVYDIGWHFRASTHFLQYEIEEPVYIEMYLDGVFPYIYSTKIGGYYESDPEKMVTESAKR